MSFFPNPITATNTTTPRQLADRFGQVLNVRDFGAVGNGQVNDAAAFQAAFTKAKQLLSGRTIYPNFRAGGVTVFVPAGTYLISNQIAVGGPEASGIKLRGEGTGATVIKCNVNSDVFIFGTPIQADQHTQNIEITDMTFYSATTMTSGSILKLVSTYGSFITNVNFVEDPSSSASPLNPSGNGLNSAFTKIFNCIEIHSESPGAGSYDNYLMDVRINNGKTGVVIGGPNSAMVQNTFLTRCEIAQCVEQGILLCNTGGTHFNQVETLYCMKGLATYPGPGQTVMWTFITESVMDTAVQDGYLFISNGGVVNGIQMVNSWASNCGRWSSGTFSSNLYGSTGRGMWISGNNVSAITMSNMVFRGNRREGLISEGSKKIFISNPLATGNGSGSSNTLGGVQFTDTTDFSVQGGICGMASDGLSSETQLAGIIINGSCDRYQVIGVNCTGNLTTGISDNGSGGTKFLTGNFG